MWLVSASRSYRRTHTHLTFKTSMSSSKVIFNALKYSVSRLTVTWDMFRLGWSTISRVVSNRAETETEGLFESTENQRQDAKSAAECQIREKVFDWKLYYLGKRYVLLSMSLGWHLHLALSLQLSEHSAPHSANKIRQTSNTQQAKKYYIRLTKRPVGRSLIIKARGLFCLMADCVSDFHSGWTLIWTSFSTQSRLCLYEILPRGRPILRR